MVGTIDFPDVGAAVNEKAAVFLQVDVADEGLWIGCKLTDDFFEKIFQGHQAFYVAVFINHESDSLAFFLKILKLRVEVGFGGAK